MLQAIKTALRITTNAFDSELYDLEAAAVADLGIAGVIPAAAQTVSAASNAAGVTVLVDAEKYKAAVTVPGVNVFAYDGTGWKLNGAEVDPEAYGLTITGAAANNTVSVTLDYAFAPIVNRAVITYCKLHFGEPADPERLKRAYDEQKAQLATATGWTDWGAV